MAKTPRQSFLLGAKDIAPVLLGIAPFALVSGVAAVDAGIPEVPAFAMSFLVFAGASQIAAAQLLGLGAPLWVVWLSTLMINLRMMMYSASLSPYVKGFSRPWKAFAAYLLTDQSFAFSLHRFTEDEGLERRWYYAGVASLPWFVWVSLSAVGVFVGAKLPPGLGLDFAIPLVFLAMIVPAVRDQASLSAALTGGLVALLARPLPNNLGLVLGAFAGILAGVLVDGRREPRP